MQIKDGAVKHTYDVVGMHCQSCVGKVTAALENVAGVRSATVTLKPPKATVEMESHVSEGILSHATEAVGGYRLEETHAAPSVAADSETAESKESLYPLFLTGCTLARVKVMGRLESGGVMEQCGCCWL